MIRPPNFVSVYPLFEHSVSTELPDNCIIFKVENDPRTMLVGDETYKAYTEMFAHVKKELGDS